MKPTFRWNQDDIQKLLAACETDGIYPLIERHIPRGTLVLDSGCGPGRYVKFLTDRGWHAVGLEVSAETVAMAKAEWPDIEIVVGDAAKSPFPADHFDAVISLGVVEHWREGPHLALAELFRTLRPGGVAIVSVPCLNGVRALKRRLWVSELEALPRAVVAAVLGKRPFFLNRRHPSARYAVYPPFGNFFEYRMTAAEFRAEVTDAGFSIIEHLPIAHIDGIFHDLNPLGAVVRFKGWSFHAPAFVWTLDKLLQKRPFLHNHIQVVVARKPPA